MAKRIVGAITIGQSPRDDVIPEIQRVLGPEVEILECGALDGMSREEVRGLTPDPGDPVLVSRTRDGAEIFVSEALVLERLRDCTRALEDRSELLLLLCTGTFPPLEVEKPVLYPEHLLRQLVASLGVHRLGVLTPSQHQLGGQRERWGKLVPEVNVQAASPYGAPEALQEAAGNLTQAGVDLVVMDCIGYTRVMAAVVREQVGCPVVLASTTLARAAAEMLQVRSEVDVGSGCSPRPRLSSM